MDIHTLQILLREAREFQADAQKTFEEDDDVESMHAIDAWDNTAGWLENLIDVAKRAGSTDYECGCEPGHLHECICYTRK